MQMAGTKWDIIGPEIKDDMFYNIIVNIVHDNDVRTILEIGASAGDGSTEAFMKGKAGKDCKLFSIEVCTERFNVLQARYSDDPNFFPYNVSSVGLDKFPPPSEVVHFMRSTPLSTLAQWPVDTVLGWLQKDIDYVVANRITENGIQLIKTIHNIKTFDCVLIDGSEFTGRPELDEVYGARIIMLDDIRAYKNWVNHNRLLGDPAYVLILQNNMLRNGFSIFQRVHS